MSKQPPFACPHCGHSLSRRFLRRLAGRFLGSIAKGKAKARPSAVARAAAMKRWAKARNTGTVSR
jgi:hypothetical protein